MKWRSDLAWPPGLDEREIKRLTVPDDRDRRARWVGRVPLRAADYEECIPFKVPAGVRHTAVVPSITVPVLKEGIPLGPADRRRRRRRAADGRLLPGRAGVPLRSATK
jgi:hypothetical protein